MSGGWLRKLSTDEAVEQGVEADADRTVVAGGRLQGELKAT